MNRRVLSVSEPEALDRILARGRPRAAQVALALAAMDLDERARWESRINRHYRACGCGSGALALVLVLVAGAGTAAGHPELVSAHLAGLVVLAPIVLLAALGTGKAIGLRLARWQLEHTVARLRRRLGSRPSASE